MRRIADGGKVSGRRRVVVTAVAVAAICVFEGTANPNASNPPLAYAALASAAHTRRHDRQRRGPLPPPPPRLRPIPRVPASEFNEAIHYPRGSREAPVIVEGVLSPGECESLCDAVVENFSRTVVDVQRKRRMPGGRKRRIDVIPNVAFDDALGLMMRSDFGDATFAFGEGLLDVGSDDGNEESPCSKFSSRTKIRDILTKCKEGLFSDEDWFQHFPSEARPSDCVILAGEGASSTLHRDPFEWTGTSVCLEGTKIWRFMPPECAVLEGNENGGGRGSSPAVNDECGSGTASAINEALDSYRLDSVAWDDGGEEGSEPGFALSAGWQSDMSLYAERATIVPTAIELANIEEIQGADRKLRSVEKIAVDLELLTPDADVLDALESTIPITMWAGVQGPGDVMLVPAYWWHQTYAPEPSLAVASQRCGAGRDAGRVLKHILDTVHRGEKTLPTLAEEGRRMYLGLINDIDAGMESSAVIDSFFEHLAKVKATRR